MTARSRHITRVSQSPGVGSSGTVTRGGGWREWDRAAVEGFLVGDRQNQALDESFRHALDVNRLLNLMIVASAPVPAQHAVVPVDFEAKASAAAGACPLQFASPGCDRRHPPLAPKAVQLAGHDPFLIQHEHLLGGRLATQGRSDPNAGADPRDDERLMTDLHRGGTLVLSRTLSTFHEARLPPGRGSPSRSGRSRLTSRDLGACGAHRWMTSISHRATSATPAARATARPSPTSRPRASSFIRVAHSSHLWLA